MKTVLLLSLSLAVALGVPVFQHPDEDQSPLLGGRVPVQGNVVVEDPAPQLSPSSDKNPQAPEHLKLKENMNEENTEVKAEAEVEVEKTEPEVQEELPAEPDLKVESEVKVEVKPEVDELEPGDFMVESEVKVEVKPEVDELEPGDFKVESEVKVEVKPEVDELEPGDFKVESEVKVELDVQSEQPEETHEAHSAMMKNVAETVRESEPLNDDDEDEEEVNQKEMSVRPEYFAAGTLRDEEEEEDMVEEEEELLRKREVLEEQPVMEVEPAMMEQTEPVPVEGEELVMEQLSESFRPEEAQKKTVVREGSEEDEDLQLGVRQQALFEVSRPGGRHCPGMFIDGKCYQFFKAAKTHADAEFFCQEQFSGGHLASISSPSAHREVMKLILTQNGGYTRSWVGGRRLDDHRFVWVDGSRWAYDDWLSGEPNNTAGLEDCVEVLAFGNGKFNDFTCWEPQAFLCSYPYQ